MGKKGWITPNPAGVKYFQYLTGTEDLLKETCILKRVCVLGGGGRVGGGMSVSFPPSNFGFSYIFISFTSLLSKMLVWKPGKISFYIVGIIYCLSNIYHLSNGQE